MSAEPTSSYLYTDVDRLEDRNTYFFSSCQSVEFWQTWRGNRHAALQRLPQHALRPALSPEVQLPEFNAAIDTVALIDALRVTDLDAILATRWLKWLIQKFEVTKRLYAHYDADKKAVRQSSYRHYDVYLKFGDLLVLAYVQKQSRSKSKPNALICLNACLKLCDTLISVESQLSEIQQRELAYLIAQEDACVEVLIETVSAAEGML